MAEVACTGSQDPNIKFSRDFVSWLWNIRELETSRRRSTPGKRQHYKPGLSCPGELGCSPTTTEPPIPPSSAPMSTRNYGPTVLERLLRPIL